jgi:chromatin assembly factor 1 subunit A
MPVKAQQSGGVQPPSKRKKLTPGEKEEKAKADQRERDEKKAAKDAEKAQAEAEKKRRREEKDAEKAAVEAEKKKRQDERNAKRQQKEDDDRKKDEEKKRKRLEKEEEERKAKEAKEKKERNQPKLNVFFKVGPSTPKKSIAQPVGASPSTTPAVTPQKDVPSTVSEYDRLFQPFFVKENVILARNTVELFSDARVPGTLILDDYLRDDSKQFSRDAARNALRSRFARRQRGRHHPSVRALIAIMSDQDGSYLTAPVDLTSVTSAPPMKTRATAQDMLRSIPMKFLGFKEDVRPPYYGTVTSASSVEILSKLARRPISKTLLPLDYDHDSEAEWMDDGEGEDIDDLDDDEEDDEDEGDEMTGFLDDSEDAGLARHMFASGMEPQSSGLCWEDRQRRGPDDQMLKYRMEFMLGEPPGYFEGMSEN